jgi:uncharacterized membrane protein
MSDTRNDWTPRPEASRDELRLVLPGRGNPARAGWTWVVEGWRLFRKAPLMWFLAMVLLFVAAIVLSLVPIVGTVVFNVLSPVIGAGFVAACRSLETGGDFELEHLLAGFKSSRFKNLAIVGVLFVLGELLLLLVFAGFVGFSVAAAIATGDTNDIVAAASASSMTILLGMLVCAALFVPMVAAYWFAPPLVFMHGLGPVEAMKQSFLACIRNLVAFLVYGLVFLGLGVLVLVPAIVPILGWLASLVGLVGLVILTMTSTYAAYRSIFTEEDGAADLTTAVRSA